MNFKIGDKVEWTSQAAGSSKTKRGVVVEIVPASFNPKATIKGLSGKPWRDHESYVVSTPKRTYWPRVSQLKLVETQMELLKEA